MTLLRRSDVKFSTCTFMVWENVYPTILLVPLRLAAVCGVRDKSIVDTSVDGIPAASMAVKVALAAIAAPWRAYVALAAVDSTSKMTYKDTHQHQLQ